MVLNGKALVVSVRKRRLQNALWMLRRTTAIRAVRREGRHLIDLVEARELVSVPLVLLLLGSAAHLG